MNVRISNTNLRGEILIPTSKSLSHRAIICAGLSNGRSIIYNYLDCDDTVYTLNALKSFGVKIRKQPDRLEIIGVKEFKYLNPIEVGDSASTLRLLLPILAVSNDEFIIKGSQRLMDRINTSDLDKLIGLDFKVNKDHVHVKGKLDIEKLELDDNLTSQLISGVLFTLPITNKNFWFKNINNPYIDLTIDMMKSFGIEFNNIDGYINTRNDYKNRSITIESDYSSAAFFISMAVLNKNITISGLNYDSIQGDRKILDYLEEMGVVFNYSDSLRVINNEIKGITKDLSITPDLVPIMAAIAAVSRGKSIFTGLEKLVLKESNRLEASYDVLKTMGADIHIENNSLIINGKPSLPGGVVVSGYNDHRIIMSLVAISSRVDKPYTITNAQHVSKSFPTFFQLYKQIGGLYESELSK